LGIVAPDGVDLERYQNLPTPPEARRRLTAHPTLSIERFTAGYTGHLYPGRGVELLLELARRLPAITFLIVGGEPRDVARLQEQARGVDNVLLTGFTPNSTVPLYQAACDVLLMPYQQQVAASSGGDIARYLSPMKLFEYMACERAILSSDLPVLREVLHAENACLLPGGDVEAWAAALEMLRADEPLRRRLAARARQDASCYTWEARAAKIIPSELSPTL
jgi:glycosyltransferase involved in cell wall biosynthesis